jgi:hypothetical protein
MEQYRSQLIDRGGIIIEVGVAYSKFGFIGDNGP